MLYWNCFLIQVTVIIALKISGNHAKNFKQVDVDVVIFRILNKIIQSGILCLVLAKNGVKFCWFDKDQNEKHGATHNDETVMRCRLFLCTNSIGWQQTRGWLFSRRQLRFWQQWKRESLEVGCSTCLGSKHRRPGLCFSYSSDLFDFSKSDHLISWRQLTEGATSAYVCTVHCTDRFSVLSHGANGQEDAVDFEP